MLVADKDVGLLLSGTGDVLGARGRRHGNRVRRQLRAGRGPGALRNLRWTRKRSCGRSMAIAAEICVYTNANVVIESLEAD